MKVLSVISPLLIAAAAIAGMIATSRAQEQMPPGARGSYNQPSPQTLALAKYEITTPTLAAVLNYLASRPYVEVQALIIDVQGQVRTAEMMEQARQREAAAKARPPEPPRPEMPQQPQPPK